MQADIDKRIEHNQPRIRLTIVPQKSNPSKIFVCGIADHSVMDGMSLLQTFALMQDDPEARKNNGVPFPDRRAPTTREILGKMGEFLTFIDELEKKKGAIEQTGNGKPSGRQSFHVSDDIDLIALKQKSKDYGVTINDLFTGACTAALSKRALERP